MRGWVSVQTKDLSRWRRPGGSRRSRRQTRVHEGVGAGPKVRVPADLNAEELEAAEAGAEELKVTDLEAKGLKAADLSAKRSAGREGAESRPLEVTPGSLEDPQETVALHSSQPALA